MDRTEKTECRANGEVIFCAMGPLLSQWPEITDLINQKMELTATPSPGAPTFRTTAGCPEPLYQVWALPSPGAFTNLCYLVTSLTFRLTFLCLFYRVPHDLRSRIVTNQQEAFHQGDLLRRSRLGQEVEDPWGGGGSGLVRSGQ